MQLFLALLASLMLVGANVLLAYYAAPLEILLTPLVVLVLTLLLLRAPGPLALRSTLAALLICAHDAGIKHYGGGTHDHEGQGFIHAFLFFGLLPAYLLVLNQASMSSSGTRRQQWAAYLVFPLILGVHLTLFGWLGVSP
ncbi:hypothetical protein LRS06_20675 [Hymenobacter sp. J193]|uniref:hypothetical protein n=1 Tax=Hymenobacter sp. J193 TaxID=2898429 RepID=UPI002150D4BC|nr:hypothetical protein [Hymenobacter sp. J193]MCR5890145.1 hypothetical protein [Hymenobacter sp. J193]